MGVDTAESPRANSMKSMARAELIFPRRLERKMLVQPLKPQAEEHGGADVP